MGRAFEVRKQAMAKTAAAKTRVYSKYGKEIYMAAKGMPDVEINSELKRVVERAKKDQVPSHIINKAIERAKGGQEDNYTLVRYEGFGPANSLFIVECLTDNPARTVAFVRNCFTKSNSKLGVSGSVSHMFKNQAVFALKGVSEDDVLNVIVENDLNVEDIQEDNQGVSVFGEPQDFHNIKEALSKDLENIEFITDEIMWVPLNDVKIEEQEDLEMFEKLTSMLDEVEDVKDVYHNVTTLEN